MVAQTVQEPKGSHKMYVGDGASIGALWGGIFSVWALLLWGSVSITEWWIEANPKDATQAWTLFAMVAILITVAAIKLGRLIWKQGTKPLNEP